MSRFHTVASLFALTAATFAISACSTGSNPASPPDVSAGTASLARGIVPVLQASFSGGVRLPAGLKLPVPHSNAGSGWLSADAKAAKNLLYVADQSAGKIEIYKQYGTNQSPVGEITQGLSGVSGLFVDSKKNLYATNFGNGTVSVYPAGKTAPSETLTGAGSPTFVVVALDGTVYVSNYNSNTDGTVLEYRKGQSKPSKTVVTFGANTFPEGIALDSHGNLYVAYNSNDGEVLEFTAANPNGVNLGIHVGYVGGLTIDNHDNLLLVDQNLPGVDVFPQGSSKPSQVIKGFSLADQIAIDKNNSQIFVSTPFNPAEVTRVSYPAGTVDDEIRTGLSSAFGVATSPDGSD